MALEHKHNTEAQDFLPSEKNTDSSSCRPENEHDVFATQEGNIEFRTVGWIRTSVIMLKMTFGIGVLTIPASLYELGAVAGCIMIVFWGALNTYSGCLFGAFSRRHSSVHTVADAAHIAMLNSTKNSRLADIAREITVFWFLLTWILSAGGSILTLTIALNAISKHATCSVVFSVVSCIWAGLLASIPKLQRIGWVAWAGAASIMAAIMTVTIAVGVRSRPAAAPPGPFELGFSAYPPAGVSFTRAWSSALSIYFASSNTPGFVPLIAEMRRPSEFNKSVITTMAFITAATMAFGFAVYYYCGQWVASPSLGSAGPTIKIVAYALALPALSATACIVVHVGAKSVFVRVLRGTRHLTSNTPLHWVVWLSSTFGVSLLGWVIAEAVPFFSLLLSLIGAFGFAPLGVCLPPLLWFSYHPTFWREDVSQKVVGALNLLMFVFGLFIAVAGTYATIVQIIEQYRAGAVSASFSCADNSNSVG